MKTILTIFLLIFCPFASALDLAIECEPADPEFQVTGYALYEWTGTATSIKITTSETPVFTVINVLPGVHNYEVRLINLWGESAAYASGKTPPLMIVPQVKPLKFKLVNIETSSNLIDWSVYASVVVPDLPRGSFYRIGFSPQ